MFFAVFLGVLLVGTGLALLILALATPLTAGILISWGAVLLLLGVVGAFIVFRDHREEAATRRRLMQQPERGIEDLNSTSQKKQDQRAEENQTGCEQASDARRQSLEDPHELGGNRGSLVVLRSEQ